jgi:hypothetical protein
MSNPGRVTLTRFWEKAKTYLRYGAISRLPSARRAVNVGCDGGDL